MWILPSQLLNSAPGMEALDLASKTSLANDCDASHIVSLRGSLKPILSVKWKRDSWMSHLFGTILKPSLTENFTDWWTSSLQDTLASRSLPQASEQGKTTTDISGLGSQMEFDFFSQEPASSRMSKDTFRWDSPQSSAIWKNWVTKLRGEYSRRRNASMQIDAQHRTSGSVFSSWPTAAARDFKGESGSGRQERKGNPTDTLPNAVAQWPTANARDWKDTITGTHPPSRPKMSEQTLGQAVSVIHGQVAQANHSTDGSRQELWATPRAGKTTDENPETWAQRQAKGDVATMPLGTQVKQWATPIMGDSHLASTPEVAAKRLEEGKVTLSRQTAAWATPNAFCYQPPENTDQWTKRAGFQQEKGVNLHKPIKSQVLHENEKVVGPMPPSAAKLNPRWVEALMGLNLGWVSPSCPASVIKNWPRFVNGWSRAITAQTNSASLETESCLPQQNELFESSSTKF